MRYLSLVTDDGREECRTETKDPEGALSLGALAGVRSAAKASPHGNNLIARCSAGCQECNAGPCWRVAMAEVAARIIKQRGFCLCLTCLTWHTERDTRLTIALCEALASLYGSYAILEPHEPLRSPIQAERAALR